MTDYEKLKKIIDEIDNLLSKRITVFDDDYQAWYLKVESFLINKFKEDSVEVKRFQGTYYALLVFSADSKHDLIKACADSLQSARNQLIVILEGIEEEKQSDILLNTNFSQVFIVHGHDGEMREAVARLIEKQGIYPIILSDEANQGTTIIEKLEKYGNVDAAICIFTSDDVGKDKKTNKWHGRARQNVILETGYFMGKLGRNRVIIISNSDLELPSDLQGIVYIGSEWKFKVLNELRAIGYSIDLNKL